MFQDKRVTPDSIRNAREDARLRVPSAFQSVPMAFAESVTAIPRFGVDVTKALMGLPARNKMDDAFEVFNAAMETPNEQWTQKTADFFARGLGYVNPFVGLGVVRPVIGAVEAAGGAIAKRLPERAMELARTPIRNFGIENMPKTIAGAAEHLTKVLATGTGISVPEAFIDHYNRETGKFEIPGAVEQSFMNGVLFMGIDLMPIVAGAIFGKHKLLSGQSYKNPLPNSGGGSGGSGGSGGNLDRFTKAFEDGHLTQEQYDWVRIYLGEPGKRDDLKVLRQKGAKILRDEGYNVDESTNKATIKLMKKEDFDNYHSGMLDQISSGAEGEHATSLTDYSAARVLDFIASENKNFVDGLDGYTGFMEERLKYEKDNLAKFLKAKNSTDLKHIDSEHPMSQRNLLAKLKSVDYDLQRLPHSVPKNLRYRASLEKKVIDIKKQLSRLKARSATTPKMRELREKQVKNKSLQLSEAKENLATNKPNAKVMSPNAELKYLENHFLTSDDLPKDYQNSHEYHRLVDLSHFSTKADALLHHIALKDHYKTQRAYHDFIKFLKKIITSKVDKFSDEKKVMNYFSKRMEKGGAPEKMEAPKVSRTRIDVPDAKAVETAPDMLDKPDHEKAIQSDVQNDKESLEYALTDVDIAGDEKLSKVFEQAKVKYEQFKKYQGTMAEVVFCDLGQIASKPEVDNVKVQ